MTKANIGLIGLAGVAGGVDGAAHITGGSSAALHIRIDGIDATNLAAEPVAADDVRYARKFGVIVTATDAAYIAAVGTGLGLLAAADHQHTNAKKNAEKRNCLFHTDYLHC